MPSFWMRCRIYTFPTQYHGKQLNNKTILKTRLSRWHHCSRYGECKYGLIFLGLSSLNFSKRSVYPDLGRCISHSRKSGTCICLTSYQYQGGTTDSEKSIYVKLILWSGISRNNIKNDTIQAHKIDELAIACRFE